MHATTPTDCPLCGTPWTTVTPRPIPVAPAVPFAPAACLGCGLVRWTPTRDAASPDRSGVHSLGDLRQRRRQEALASRHGRRDDTHRVLALGPEDVATLADKEPLLALHHLQALDVLNRLPSPREALKRFSGWMLPEGRLIVSVPSAAHPQALLRVPGGVGPVLGFTATTLRHVAVTAGLKVIELLREGTDLVLVAEPRDALESRQPAPVLDLAAGRLLVARLATFPALETMRRRLMTTGADPALLHPVLELLGEPGFPDHLQDVVGELVDLFVCERALRSAMLVLQAAMAGPDDGRARQHFRTQLEALRDAG